MVDRDTWNMRKVAKKMGLEIAEDTVKEGIVKLVEVRQ